MGISRHEYTNLLSFRRMQAKRVIMINDCSDANARLRIESQVAQAFPGVPTSFYGAEPFATLSLSFLLAESEFNQDDVVLFNAAPRGASEVHADNRAGVMVFVMLKNGALLVGPNDGYSLSLIKDQITDIYMKKGDDGNNTGSQFRSAYVFPKAAGEFVATPDDQLLAKYEPQDLSLWPWTTPAADHIIWFDSFDNIKTTCVKALEDGKLYTLRIVREGLLVGELKLPYREKMTQLAPGELGLITGSSFDHHGIEIVRRTGMVGLTRTRRFMQETYGFELLIEDEVHIS